MGLIQWLAGFLFGRPNEPIAQEQIDAAFPKRRRVRRLSFEELCRRLDVSEATLKGFRPRYTRFQIPKRAGGSRRIDAPDAATKKLQRAIDKRVFGGVRLHAAAMAYVRGRSYVHHAALHADRAVVVSMDLENFFGSIRRWRVEALARWLGWDEEAAGRIADICTLDGRLPQGAPTSPRLANILSIPMDRRLAGLARSRGAVYSRYADDLVFSFDADEQDVVHEVVHIAKLIIWESWDLEMEIHHKRKLHIRRAGWNRQEVCGLVVNDGPPRLPRETRRALRAMRHRLQNGVGAETTPTQLAGWESLEEMIQRQGAPKPHD